MEFRQQQGVIVLDLHPGVRAWFSTRQGGVSEAPYRSCNLSYGVGDIQERVTENRRRTLQAGAGRPLEDLVMPHQVHQAHIAWIDGHQRGRGALGPHGKPPIEATDGFLTRSPDVVLGLGFADCVPIFLTSKDGLVVGILHAGWRGTVAHIQQEAIRLLEAEGIMARDVLIGIGPSIGSCCYEVDSPVYDQVAHKVGTFPLTRKDESHWWLDLKEANSQLLQEAGVPQENIVVATYCTGCQPDLFYSYRIEGAKTGRMGGYICLTKP